MIEWTEAALVQLDRAQDFIAFSNSPAVARKVIDRIVETVQQLAVFPLSGRAGRISNTRELVISRTPFIAAYSIHPGRIVILALYHGAQKWPEQF